jgi:hypothetical protein
MARHRLPLIRSWGEPGNPLPLRTIVSPGRRRNAAVSFRPDFETGPTNLPFDFSGHIERLCRSMARRCSVLRHLDFSRILFGVTQARSSQAHGLQARVTPLRFRGGRLTRERRGVVYQVQRYYVANRDLLYLVTFCLPRFLDLDFDEKFITLFHELYHISPEFDGDLRRHEGRYSVHSHSQCRYDAHMAKLAREYLASGPDPRLHAFLRLDFGQLEARHNGIVGVVVPRPKIVPVPLASAARNVP